MNFTDIFIKRPVLSIVLSTLILLLGIQSASRLEIREFPKLEDSVIHVETYYPGANAETVQGFVTTPLQQRIAGAQGIEYITSSSIQGRSLITIHVRLGADSAETLTEVITKINEARSVLPREIENPIASTMAPGNSLMYLAFFSKNLGIEQVSDYLIRSVQPEIATIEGVGAANMFGGKYFAMRIWTDPVLMAAMGVTAEDIRTAIQDNNYVATTGSTKGQWVVSSVNAETDLTSTDEFGDIVVRQVDERRVRLKDVAEIELASEDTESYSTSTGKEAIFIMIESAPGANPLDVARRVRDILPVLQAKMPSDLTVTIDSDASIYISQAIYEVMKTLAEAALIVILVIFLFLGSFRVVFIPIIAIPLSLIGVLFFIYLAGFSINLLTLLALVIAIGLVVDDAIVMVENVHRFIEEGEQPFDAAIKGARQVAMPIIAMSITLATVYVPIAFLGGLTGTLFSEFALTLAGAVIISGIVALTMSPMLCAKFLRDHEHQGKLADWLDERFLTLRNGYEKMLQHCLNNRGAVIMFGICIFISLPVLLSISQSELAPAEDQGTIYVASSAPDHANLDYLNRFTAEIVDIWQQQTEPGIKYSFQVNHNDMAFGGLILYPWDERNKTQQQLQTELQGKLSKIAGLEIFTFGEPPLPGGESGLPVNFVLSSTADYESIVKAADKIVEAARQSGHFMFITQDLRFTRPEINIAIDREKAARLGISMKSIGDTLGLMLGESDINRFSMEGRSYKVIPQAPRDFRLTKEWLERYYIRTNSNDLIPLSTIITLYSSIKPNNLTQYQQLNSTNIKAMLMPGTSLGKGLDFLKTTAEEIAPAGFRTAYEGESRRYIQESSQFLVLFGTSLLLVYLVLSAQFNSFRDPFVVLLCVPMSTFGAVVPLALGFATLNIFTQIGLVTLIGLISKHGILIVDFANQRRAQGVEIREAVLQAAALRLRPILMTTAATTLGIAPLLFAFGAGANSRFSIGLVITAGMLIGTLFTLFVVPVYYLAFEGKRDFEIDNTAQNSTKVSKTS